MKKTLAMLLAAVLLIASCACASAAAFTPGTYEGTARGMYSDITVAVTVDENNITDVTVKEQNDTRIIAAAAVAAMPGRIVDAQSFAVDTVTGATISSYGILNAAKNALKNAGFDLSAYQTKVEAEKMTGADEEYDLVIVGAGAAGLGAAIEAGRLNSDASILVLEKLAYTGGSGALSGSMIVAGGTAWNEMPENVDYTTEEFVEFFKKRASEQDRLPEGMWINEKLIAGIADKSTEYFTYLIEQDIPLRPNMWFASASWAEGRGISGFVNEKKASIQDPEAAMTVWGDWFTAHAAQFAEIRTNSAVTGLLVENGTVTGVKVEDLDKTYNVKAKKVILACGGLSANIPLFRELNADVPNIETVFNFACAGDTGDHFELVEGLDAAKTGYGFIAYHGFQAPYGFHTPYGKAASGAFNVWVNNSGERFTNEKGYYYQLGFRILEQDKGLVYGVSDATNASVAVLEQAVAEGYAYKADTLEALAAQIGVDAATLEATIAKYNADYEAGAGDTVYGQTAAQMKPVTTAPYYAMKVGVSVLGTMASLKCDEQCRILSNAGEAIENLYGAGEVIFGNLFVQEYVASGCAMGSAVYTGAIAAQDALTAIAK